MKMMTDADITALRAEASREALDVAVRMLVRQAEASTTYAIERALLLAASAIAATTNFP
ncbi:hypothetical protein [Methylibium sp.]|uniref:hypothetical protein n=1 Tax=Methylibium sp. TaxID=2067992 RepID=UPI0017A413F5|nr:hypothetical protein [Methylibium sp.]MBA3590358.1 hypothetical protein [Methylibium sp.]